MAATITVTVTMTVTTYHISDPNPDFRRNPNSYQVKMLPDCSLRLSMTLTLTLMEEATITPSAKRQRADTGPAKSKKTGRKRGSQGEEKVGKEGQANIEESEEDSDEKACSPTRTQT